MIITSSYKRMSCTRCNWQTQPAEYGFTECFCDLLTPYQVKEKEKKEDVKIVKEPVKQSHDESLLKRTGC
jgi:hypothetical protein